MVIWINNPQSKNSYSLLHEVNVDRESLGMISIHGGRNQRSFYLVSLHHHHGASMSEIVLTAEALTIMSAEWGWECRECCSCTSLRTFPKFTNNILKLVSWLSHTYVTFVFWWDWKSQSSVTHMQLLLYYDFQKQGEHFLGTKPPRLWDLWVSGKPGHQAAQIQCPIYSLTFVSWDNSLCCGPNQYCFQSLDEWLFGLF